jgi:hypothetical protein
MTNTITESHDSPPYFQYLLAPTNYLIYNVVLINQVLIDSVLRTNYLMLLLTYILFNFELTKLFYSKTILIGEIATQLMY